MFDLRFSTLDSKRRETKILAKSIKQVDPVIGDLVRQVEEFRHSALCILRSAFLQAAAAEQRLRDKALPSFDEFLFLCFRAANVEPYPFEWLDYGQPAKEYAALLVRVWRMCGQGFGA